MSTINLAIPPVSDPAQPLLANPNLPASEERFRRVIDHVSDAILVDDREGRVVFANDRFLELLGLSRAALPGLRLEDYVAPAWREALRDRHDRRMAGEEVPAQFQYEGLRRDGSVLWIEVSVVPLRDEQGAIAGTQSALRDITERKQAEAALRASERRYRSLVDGNLAGVFRTTLDGRILTCNDAFARLYGYASREDILSRPALELYQGPEAREEFIQTLTATGSLINHEFMGRQKDGTDVWMLENVRLVEDETEGAGPIIEGTILDISERKNAEQSLKESEARNRALIAAIPDLLFTNRRDGEFLAFHAPDPGLLYAPPESFIHRRIKDVLPGPVADQFMKIFAEVLDSGQPQEATYSLPVGGVEKHFEARIVPYANDTVMSILRDITEEKRVEAALREKARELLEAERVARLGSYRTDLVSGGWESSAVLDEIFGIDAGFRRDVAGWLSLIHPDEREGMEAYVAQEILGKRQPFDREYRIIRHDDRRERWVHGLGALVADRDGSAVELFGTIQDITESKLNLLALSRTNRALEMLSSCNEALIRAADEGSLLESVCRIVVEKGGYRMASVGLALDDPAKSIVVAARAGEAGEFLGTFPRTWAADPSKATCPAGEAIRSGKVVVVDDLVRETASAVIARQALEGNVEKAVYLPLKNALRTFGVLAVCSSERGRVNEDEIDLLAELADNIAFGIASLRAQTEQARADTALLASLKEKEALLREVHHRVKNNLQIINSLLRLEARRVGHDVTKTVLQEMQGRIQSMAVLHETLYRSGNFAAVDLAAYLRQLANQLFRALLVRSGAVRLNLDLVSVSVDIDKAIPCGLIVNELVTNSLKHGFADERTGDLWIGLRPAEDGVAFTLSVSDNGAGLPADFDLKRQASLGLQLVSDLARQLQGDLKIGPGPQAAFEVTFNPGRRRATTEIPSPVDGAAGTGEFSRADG